MLNVNFERFSFHKSFRFWWNFTQLSRHHPDARSSARLREHWVVKAVVWKVLRIFRATPSTDNAACGEKWRASRTTNAKFNYRIRAWELLHARFSFWAVLISAQTFLRSNSARSFFSRSREGSGASLTRFLLRRRKRSGYAPDLDVFSSIYFHLNWFHSIWRAEKARNKSFDS